MMQLTINGPSAEMAGISVDFDFSPGPELDDNKTRKDDHDYSQMTSFNKRNK